MIQPVIDFITEWLTMWIFRAMSASAYRKEEKLKSKASTNSEEVSRFMDIYAGPPYLFYYQCANMNSLIIICFMFGPAIPYLYTIALIGIAIQYFCDRLTMAYFYRMPPQFSTKLT